MDNRFASLALLAFLAAMPETLLAGVGSWTSNGPEGGSVLALATHPSHPSTVYLATSQRLYKSVDAGALWAPLNLFGQYDLLIPTSDASIAYATRTDDFGAPFLRTSDGGETWVSREHPRGRLFAVTVDPNDPASLYAVTGSGAFRTSDGGNAWEQIANPADGRFSATGIAVDPTDSRVLYAVLVLGQGLGVYRSSDRGATWSRTNLREATWLLLFDPRNPSRLFALSSSGLHVTTNQGESWRRLVSERNLTRLAIDPADSNRLYVVSAGVVLRSSDGGETVSSVSVGSGEHVGIITAAGSGVVLAGSEKGVFRSEDEGRAWGAANRGIREVSARWVVVDPTDPAVVFAASPAGVYESRDGGGDWNAIPRSPEANVVAIDPTNRSTLYAAGRGVHKSTNGGETWQNKSPQGIVDYIAALVIDPNNPRRVFASYLHVSRSLDGADNWQVVMRAEDNVASYYYPPTIDAMAIAPSDSAVVYGGGSTNEYADGLFSRSEDGGTSWSTAILSGAPIRALAVDPCDAGFVYAATWRGVYRSADGGVTWSEPGLPGVFVSSLALDPRHSSSVFAATSQGLFWTNDRGASWQRFEPALGEPVQSLAVDPSGRFLHAATDRGVFSFVRTFEPCANGPDRLCLIGAKYRVSLTARNPRTGALVTGRAILEGDQFGYFSFPEATGDPDFPEVFVKMVNASGAPPPYGGYDWVFHTSLTDFDYWLTVLDTQTGRIRTYQAADSESLTCGTVDTSAFPRDCSVEETGGRVQPESSTVASAGDLSLLGGRFRARLQVRDPRTKRIAEGTALPRADGFGYFSLPAFTGDPTYPEVFVKMTDATALPGGQFWFFHTGLTDLDYTLTVTDTRTGAVRTYSGGARNGTGLCGQADTAAFRN